MADLQLWSHNLADDFGPSSHANTWCAPQLLVVSTCQQHKSQTGEVDLLELPPPPWDRVLPHLDAGLPHQYAALGLGLRLDSHQLAASFRELHPIGGIPDRDWSDSQALLQPT